MKKSHGVKQQKGFFDLGFSLAVLALSGAFAVATTPAEDDDATVRDPQIEVVTEIETGNGNLDFRD